MFEPEPMARADLKAGTVYAIAGERGWLYYGQVARSKNVALFRYRGRQLEAPENALRSPVMSVVSVAYPSITRALRSGNWKKTGRYPLAAEFKNPWVQWPVGTSVVTVWSDEEQLYTTRVDDPLIQDLEVAAVWDAQEHVPKRLTADFGEEEAEWYVGGPVWRERRVKEEWARRFPGQSYRVGDNPVPV